MKDLVIPQCPRSVPADILSIRMWRTRHRMVLHGPRTAAGGQRCCCCVQRQSAALGHPLMRRGLRQDKLRLLGTEARPTNALKQLPTRWCHSATCLSMRRLVKASAARRMSETPLPLWYPSQCAGLGPDSSSFPRFLPQSHEISGVSSAISRSAHHCSTRGKCAPARQMMLASPCCILCAWQATCLLLQPQSLV